MGEALVAMHCEATSVPTVRSVSVWHSTCIRGLGSTSLVGLFWGGYQITERPILLSPSTHPLHHHKAPTCDGMVHMGGKSWCTIKDFPNSQGWACGPSDSYILSSTCRLVALFSKPLRLLEIIICPFLSWWGHWGCYRYFSKPLRLLEISKPLRLFSRYFSKPLRLLWIFFVAKCVVLLSFFSVLFLFLSIVVLYACDCSCTWVPTLPPRMLDGSYPTSWQATHIISRSAPGEGPCYYWSNWLIFCGTDGDWC